MMFASAVAWGGSPKRGLSENQFAVEGQMKVFGDNVTWYYNWGNTPNRGLEDGVLNYEGIEYVPMCWNTNYNADAIREYCKNHPNTKYLLGFNEPNFTAQANMTPQQAADAWPAVQALAKELGLKLVAPALNYSPNAPYNQPTKWMDEFVALVGLDAFDYTAVHNYGGLGVMKTIAGDFHDKYGKDVWVTEFCLWPNEGKAGDKVAPEAQMASMAESVEWLETTPWIYRYAWFKAIGANNSSSGPNYGLVEKTSGGGPQDWHLTPQGFLYTTLGQFGDDCTLAVGQEHSAVRYVHGEKLRFNRCDKAAHPAVISEFNGGALVDWRFEVPEAGEYTLSVKVGGVGEPTRYDPTIAVAKVAADGTVTTLHKGKKYTLPGADADFISLTWVVTLEAGAQTLRLYDGNSYSPSGMMIDSVSLTAGSNGVEAVATDELGEYVDIYTLQGVAVARGVNVSELGQYRRQGGIIAVGAGGSRIIL